MMRFQDADAIVKEIEQRKNRGYGFEHFKQYMNEIGNPHLQLKCIHIAGTNGKGSTTNYVRAILQEAGYQVGSFTSPYLITHYDRIRINDVDIHKDEFLAIVNEYYDSWMKWDLSMFEIDMCIACIYFLRKQVDICIFEVGLGGRLDFTNIIQPMVSVITNIGLDHMALLGDSYKQIAQEKAGIIKKQIPLITSETKQECLEVFTNVCEQQQTKMIQTKDVVNMHFDGTHMCFDYGAYTNLKLASLAKYQCYNAALAIEIIQHLPKIQVQEEHMRQALLHTIWKGRFEVVSKDPLVIIDGAHNGDGISALCDSLDLFDDPVIVFSVLKDKNFDEMIKQLQQVSSTIILTQMHNERSLDMHELANTYHMHYIEDIKDAITYAKSLGRSMVITGSLYFISDVRLLFQ